MKKTTTSSILEILEMFRNDELRSADVLSALGPGYTRSSVTSILSQLAKRGVIKAIRQEGKTKYKYLPPTGNPHKGNIQIRYEEGYPTFHIPSPEPLANNILQKLRRELGSPEIESTKTLIREFKECCKMIFEKLEYLDEMERSLKYFVEESKKAGARWGALRVK